MADMLFSLTLLLMTVKPASGVLLTAGVSRGESLETTEVTLVCERLGTEGFNRSTSEISFLRQRADEENFSTIVTSQFPPSGGCFSPVPKWKDDYVEERASLVVSCSDVKGTLTVKGITCTDRGKYKCEITATSDTSSAVREVEDSRCSGTRTIGQLQIISFLGVLAVLLSTL